jgi:hypothetical protein
LTLSHGKYAKHLQCWVSNGVSPTAPDDIPTASVRSVGVRHAMWPSLPMVGREGEPRPAGPAVANETILECGHMKSVSMPSALLVEAGAGAGLLAMRAGSVKERRALPEPSATGACSASCEGVEDMAGVSGGHFAVGEGEGEGEGTGEGKGESEGVTEGDAESEAGPQSSSWASSAKGGLSLTGVGRKCLALPLLRNGLATGRRTGGQFHHKQRRRLRCHNPQLARGPPSTGTGGLRGNTPKTASIAVVRETSCGLERNAIQ